MPVKIYVGLDVNGRELPATHSRESWATLDITRRLWLAYHEQPTQYAVCISPTEPSADVLIISERGVGVIELKDNFGEMRGRANEPWEAWYNGKPRSIYAGTHDEEPRMNPHKQVQDYGWTLKQMLVQFNLRQPKHKQWLLREVDQIWIDTAVCFTHPKATLTEFRNNYRTPPSVWEKFRILTPEEVVEWAHGISFQLERYISAQNEPHFERFFLTEQQIEDIVTGLLGMVESREITGLISAREPYAYLTLLEDDNYVQSFPLYPGITVIGRHPGSQVLIPQRCESVSRHHARILNSQDGTFIEDLGSKHGTYVDDQDVKQKITLRYNQVITLCPVDAGSKGCQLKFVRTLHQPPPTI